MENPKDKILRIVDEMCDKQRMLESTHWSCHSDLEFRYSQLEKELQKALDDLIENQK